MPPCHHRPLGRNEKVAVPVAVGPPVTRRPPHRSQQAELSHWAPASGNDVQTDSPSAVSQTALVAASSGSVSGDWFAGSDSPWPDPFSPPAPPPGISALLCSLVSSILWVCPTSRDRSSLSCSLGIHNAGPPDRSGGPIPRSPACEPRLRRAQRGSHAAGFRVRSVPTCTGSSTAREPDTPRLGGAPGVAFPLPLEGRPPEG
jgi:hypothetical protein